jgi:sigma-B regulation protein RsbU (phosphoserine phosphatase)
MMLHNQGHEVVEAADGELAWRIIEESDVSFVVSDWMMPNLAGVDLCRRIRSAQFDRYIYVILCTSRGAKSDLIEGMDAGADDFLVKPLSPQELRVKVRAGERLLSLQQDLAEKNRDLSQINRQLQAAHQLVEEDLKAAAWMQQRLLPQQAQQISGVSCTWRLCPSGYIAGDIFNCFAMGREEIGFYLLDVCGHGVPAAMLSVTLSMMMTPDAASGSPLKRYDPETGESYVLSPQEAVRELNRRFHSIDDRYFTMVYGLYSVPTSTVRIAQAGHPGPALMRKGKRPEIIGTGGMPIGIWPEMEFDCMDLKVEAGDKILLYSDGLTECVNDAEEPFGESRLLALLDRHDTQSLEDLLDGLLAEHERWRGGSHLADDISLLAIEIGEK